MGKHTRRTSRITKRKFHKLKHKPGSQNELPPQKRCCAANKDNVFARFGYTRAQLSTIRKKKKLEIEMKKAKMHLDGTRVSWTDAVGVHEGNTTNRRGGHTHWVRSDNGEDFIKCHTSLTVADQAPFPANIPMVATRPAPNQVPAQPPNPPPAQQAQPAAVPAQQAPSAVPTNQTMESNASQAPTINNVDSLQTAANGNATASNNDVTTPSHSASQQTPSTVVTQHSTESTSYPAPTINNVDSNNTPSAIAPAASNVVTPAQIYNHASVGNAVSIATTNTFESSPRAGLSSHGSDDEQDVTMQETDGALFPHELEQLAKSKSDKYSEIFEINNKMKELGDKAKSTFSHHQNKGISSLLPQNEKYELQDLVEKRINEASSAFAKGILSSAHHPTAKTTVEFATGFLQEKLSVGDCLQWKLHSSLYLDGVNLALEAKEKKIDVAPWHKHMFTALKNSLFSIIDRKFDETGEELNNHILEVHRSSNN